MNEVSSDEELDLSTKQTEATGHKQRKRRTVKLADSSDDSGTEDVTNNQTRYEQNIQAEETALAVNTSLQDSSENEESSQSPAKSEDKNEIRKKTKRKIRRAKIADSSSDESDAENNDSAKITYGTTTTTGTMAEEDKPCCSKLPDQPEQPTKHYDSESSSSESDGDGDGKILIVVWNYSILCG
ncbi:uncharacterized protein LOC144744902 [Ciona intestinalis]